ncbi:MAG: MATE family efflux transporter [Flavobacteriales bacterium MED-G22]|nr:MAG: MATE family efflux transporter [Flavobacteriales bacterium MED-G22]|tara:strand:- start:6786 stop:8138 length:1353 start_codon:yes stop_codon:yes gene_type:complete
MSESSSSSLATQAIPKLLIQQALPASVGILVMSLNILIDTLFVGQWIGAYAIAAINIVLPVSFFIAALGMSIGIGGSSIISRALGDKNKALATKTFGNQLALTLTVTLLFSGLGLFFSDQIIPVFGGKDTLFDIAKIYYVIVLYGVPVLGFCMMSNTVIRAEGKPKNAMYAMLLPSISNLLLDYVFIKVLDLGMYGAAWATTLSYGVCAGYILYFFSSKKSELNLVLSDFKLDAKIVKEIGALGFVTLSRQAMVSITVLLVNNILYQLGGASILAVYAIISRMLMFATFPILGITQGFLPIAGYNFGAKLYDRVRQVIWVSLKYATLLATLVFLLIFYFADAVPYLFTKEFKVANATPSALRWVFAALPIVGIQLIGAAFFQAIGKAIPALLLTLTRQGFFFIPLLFLFSSQWGIIGVWMSFPASEVLATLVTAYFLRQEIKKQRLLYNS